MCGKDGEVLQGALHEEGLYRIERIKFEVGYMKLIWELRLVVECERNCGKALAVVVRNARQACQSNGLAGAPVPFRGTMDLARSLRISLFPPLAEKEVLWRTI
jgi:hypothetical protein